jgi:hypothetical protein
MRVFDEDALEETEGGRMLWLLGFWTAWQPAAWKQQGIAKGPWTWPF